MFTDPLLYATPRPRPRLWGLARVLKWGIATTLAITAFGFADPFRRHVLELWFQGKAEHFTAPINRVAYEPEARDAAKLIASDSHYVSTRTVTGALAASYVPEPLSALQRDPLERVVFLHELLTRSGNSRMVAVK